MAASKCKPPDHSSSGEQCSWSAVNECDCRRWPQANRALDRSQCHASVPAATVLGFGPATVAFHVLQPRKRAIGSLARASFAGSLRAALIANSRAVGTANWLRRRLLSFARRCHSPLYRPDVHNTGKPCADFVVGHSRGDVNLPQTRPRPLMLTDLFIVVQHRYDK